MATNEVHRYANWIDLPIVPSDALVDNGDPIVVGNLAGVIQAYGDSPVTYTIGSLTVTDTESSTSLEAGWASVALVGSFLFDIEDGDTLDIGAPVYVTAATDSARAELTIAGTDVFGHKIGMSSDGRTEVRLVGSFA